MTEGSGQDAGRVWDPGAFRRAHLWLRLPDWAEVSTDSDIGRDLLDRYRRWPLAGVLAFRGISAFPPVVILVQMYGFRRLTEIIVVATSALLANLAMVRPVWRSRRLATREILPWLGVDLAVAVGLNLWSAAVVPGPINDAYHDVFWFWCMGSVCLWTAWFGPLAGLAVVLGLVPVQLAMTAISGWQPAGEIVPMVVGRTVWLLAGTIASAFILVILRLSAGAALAEGWRAGRQAGQIRLLRELHDTALQTLEAIGLSAGSPGADPAARLRAVAVTARTQAEDLRAVLRRSGDVGAGADQTLVRPEAEIASTVAEAARQLRAAGVGLRSDCRPLRGVEVTGGRSDALRAGVREALVNARRHARAATVTVEGRVLADRVQVTVTDDGCGFDPDVETGFGITQSITARLQEVGGGARIRSRPGRGTTVATWVPR